MVVHDGGQEGRHPSKGEAVKPCYTVHIGALKTMTTKKKRLSLDVDAEFQQRLKAVTTRKGVSMRQYCEAAIDNALAQDEAKGEIDDRPAHVRFAELRQKYFGGKPLPGNSVDLLHEARAIREAESADW